MQPEPLDHIFPGSWINANFDVWIGAEEDNKAWRLLLDARQAYERGCQAFRPKPARLALEELLIAEGSDWNWWYGPEHESANRVEFDQIYREHLANVYRALGIAAARRAFPSDSAGAGAKRRTRSRSGPISPVVNGVVDSYFEWLGAGLYKVDPRQGSMHGKRALVKDVHYGANADFAFLRVDFEEDASKLENLEVQVHSGASQKRLAVVRIERAEAVVQGNTAHGRVQRRAGDLDPGGARQGDAELVFLAGRTAHRSDSARGSFSCR